MEGNGHPALLPKAGRADLLGLAQHDRSIGNDDMLVVVRVDRIRDKHLDRADGIAVQPVHQHRIQRRALVDNIRLAGRRIDIDLGRTLGSLGCLRLRLLTRVRGEQSCCHRQQGSAFGIAGIGSQLGAV